MKTQFRYNFRVRGYEIDSFGHVNNAVYINYLEQARWEILDEINLLKSFAESGNLLVVVETNIKYIRELKLLDKAFVVSEMKIKGYFLEFFQNIYNQNNEKIAKASVKCLFVDKERTPLDIPQEISKYLVR